VFCGKYIANYSMLSNNNKVIIAADQLQKDIYIYTLVVDDELLTTKRFVKL
jgi:hypothetical protein